MPDFSDHSPESLQQTERYKAKKNITKDHPPPLTKPISEAIEHLAKQSKLFELLKAERPVCKCGAFFVEKGGTSLLRTILDGRWSNCVFNLAQSKFSFFSLDALRQTLDNLSVHDKWYVLNFDPRH